MLNPKPSEFSESLDESERLLRRQETDSAAHMVVGVVGILSVLNWPAFARLSDSLVRPQENQLRITLSEWAFWGGTSLSIISIVEGFLRRERRKKVDTVSFGVIMPLLWLFAAIGSIPVS
jgi:hypothetical protein